MGAGSGLDPRKSHSPLLVKVSTKTVKANLAPPIPEQISLDIGVCRGQHHPEPRQARIISLVTIK